MNSYNTQGPMTLFRVFVEDTGHREALRDLVNKHLVDSAFTLLFGEVFWWGQSGQTAIIEVYAPELFRSAITVLATDLRVAFNQKVVAVAEHNDRVSFYYV